MIFRIAIKEIVWVENIFEDLNSLNLPVPSTFKGALASTWLYLFFSIFLKDCKTARCCVSLGFSRCTKWYWQLKSTASAKEMEAFFFFFKL